MLSPTAKGQPNIHGQCFYQFGLSCLFQWDRALGFFSAHWSVPGQDSSYLCALPAFLNITKKQGRQNFFLLLDQSDENFLTNKYKDKEQGKTKMLPTRDAEWPWSRIRNTFSSVWCFCLYKPHWISNHMGIRQANKKITLFFLHEIPKSTIKMNVHTMKITFFVKNL